MNPAVEPIVFRGRSRLVSQLFQKSPRPFLTGKNKHAHTHTRTHADDAGGRDRALVFCASTLVRQHNARAQLSLHRWKTRRREISLASYIDSESRPLPRKSEGCPGDVSPPRGCRHFVFTRQLSGSLCW